MRIAIIAALLCASNLLFAQKDPQWMRFPAISPDGNTIAFAYQGDIYVVPSGGGTAMPVTLNDSYDYMPVWSPDGQSIAFASDRHGNFDVFMVSVKGGDAKRLTFNSSNDSPTDFTPDGKNVVFYSSRQDLASNQQNPSGAMPEFYSVPIIGGTEKLVITTPVLDARYSADGDKIVFQDQKGYEDPLRKHHTSSVTRDIWIYSFSTKKYTQLTMYSGEDLNPVFSPDNKSIYFTSDHNGTMNIMKMGLDGKGVAAISNYKDHPVRHLSCSSTGVICYTNHGKIYTMKEGEEAKELLVSMYADKRYVEEKVVPVAGVSEFSLSPNGKEVAFIHRGEVFVSSVAEGTTKRITNTPEQERSVSFGPDGRTLLYAGERNNSWNLYTCKIERKEESYFFNSTVLKEETLLDSPAETFQPSFSPDGKEVAFLEERTALKVINIASKAVREIVPADKNYSYSDGDQHYEWSPDGKWFMVNYLPKAQWISQMGLVSSDGKGTVKDLSESGYGAYGPQWMMEGKMILWASDKDGMKNHASWGGQSDVYATFLTQEAFDVFKMNAEEFALYNEGKEKAEKEKSADAEKTKKEEKGKKDEKKDEKKDDKEIVLKPVVIEMDGLKDRKARLTIHSSTLSDAYVTRDGSKLFYICQFEKGFDLWQTDLRTKETKVAAKLDGSPASMVADSTGKMLFILTNGGILKFDIDKSEVKPVAVKGEMILNEGEERAYLFEHIWRQVQKKFYVKDLHNVRWDFYKAEYAKVVGDVNNNYDFADMMSEMLGELNASHTGAFYGNPNPNGDQTASLALFYDNNYTGNGLKIVEVVKGSPVQKSGSKIAPGVVIEKIDGVEIKAGVNYYGLLNRKAGVVTLLSLLDPSSNKRWEETVKPIGRGMENELLYRRWVENCRSIVDSLSGGKVGYVHVRGMDDGSYRKVFDEAIGKYGDREALVVDTRFNGGGWLHDDLATFLSGETYMAFQPRGQELGYEPMSKWRRTSCVVMNESNYSDAHMFPYTYKALGVGKLVGMPVAGTGTAVWWEPLQNGVVFGIPQVGMVGNDGRYLENQQLEPDYKVANDPEIVSQGRDQQLEKAVEILLNGK